MSDNIDAKRMKEELDRDSRDVSDLWNDALRNYKGIVGVGLQPKFASVDEMIKFGTEEMNAFHRFRHNEKKVDKLRSLFISNMDYIQKGAQQLIAAATPAFPPAAAIGTAFTYMLSACKQVSADYDVVTAFFEDMNAFLQRITILESRLPSYPAYRNCLMDVFTALLEMCGFATKYVELGRFKKWVLNMIRGQDGDLAGARKKMDKTLSRLQSATEYAILGNTEKLQEMSAELRQNEEMQTLMLEAQTKMLEAVIESQDGVRNDLKDIRKLLSVFEERKREESAKQKTTKSGKPPTSNRVRAFFYSTIDPAHEYRNIKDASIPDMSTWIFSEIAWEEWTAQERDKGTSKLLCISGASGSGKSHLAASAHDRLARLAEQHDGNTCVVHFYFRETREETRMFFYAIHWIVIQIAEWNTHLCEKVNIELAREDVEIDVDDWKDVWNKLVKPLFSGSSKSRLQIIFDSLDELGHYEQPLALECLKLISESDLNISVLCTARPSLVPRLEALGTTIVHATKEMQHSDLKVLTWHHLNNDSGLRKLSKYMKQRISSKLEEKADCLLYAENILRQFNSLGREPLILKSLDHSMPQSLEELYTNMLADVLRKTSLEQQQALKNLFMWLAFSIRPITLSDALSLTNLLPGNLELEEELQSQQLSRLLRIADLEEAIDLSSPQSNQSLEELQTLRESPDAAYNDSNLPIKFQERSMRGFFRSAKATEDPTSLRTPGFEAHRQIFITLSHILCGTAGENISDGLRSYAASFWVMHLGWMWYFNQASSSTEEEKASLLDNLGAIVNNEGDVATNIELQGVDYGDLGIHARESTMKFFASMGNGLEGRIKDSTAAWAKEVATNGKKAFVNLAKAHVRNWFRATDLKSAQRSYKFARSALYLTDLDHLLQEQGDSDFDYNGDDDGGEAEQSSEEILAISKAFPDATTASTPWAVALLLTHHGHYAAALPSAQRALDELTPSDGTDPLNKRFRALDLLANVQRGLGDHAAALATITSALAQTTGSDIPSQLLRQALVTRAATEAALDRPDDAAASYAAARGADASTPMPGDVLQDELAVYLAQKQQQQQHEPALIVAAVGRWTPLERLAWMTWDYADKDSGVAADQHVAFRRACGRAGEGGAAAFMESAYGEVIALLDAVGAGAPMRLELAAGRWEVRGDVAGASALVDEVLDGASDGELQRFTDEDPAYTLVLAVNLAADLLYEQFRTAADGARKAELVEEMRGVTGRSLARAVSSWRSMVNHHTVVLAKMVRKMGPAAEFEGLLRKAFDVAYDALVDGVGWNDSDNLRSMAEVLSALGGLDREARIVLSAQFSRLDPAVAEGDDELKEEGGGGAGDASEIGDEGDVDDGDSLPDDEGDLDGDVWFTCGGECNPPVQWRAWKGRPLYFCLVCYDTGLCEDCYRKRQEYNKGAESSVGATYCGLNHKYLKGPIEGWKGIKDGKIIVDGEEPVNFKNWLNELKEKGWKAAWERFWLAED